VVEEWSDVKGQAIFCAIVAENREAGVLGYVTSKMVEG
jgi:hypothetical protein